MFLVLSDPLDSFGRDGRDEEGREIAPQRAPGWVVGGLLFPSDNYAGGAGKGTVKLPDRPRAH